MAKPEITVEQLIEAAQHFCDAESVFKNKALFGVTDGKAVDSKNKNITYEGWEHYQRQLEVSNQLTIF